MISYFLKGIKFLLIILSLSTLIEFTGCAKRVPLKSFEGEASYYDIEHHGKRTASGERYDMYDYTAAHEILPFGTKVRVTNLLNQRCVVVRINDRGPFKKNRIIDLSWVAAKKLRFLKEGLARVRLEVLKYPSD
jgi:rare lipoprotein A